MEPRKNRIASFILDEDAPTFLEYGLLIIVIALVVVVGATVFGSAIEQMFQSAGTYSN